jgi:hypothetical protein
LPNTLPPAIEKFGREVSETRSTDVLINRTTIENPASGSDASRFFYRRTTSDLKREKEKKKKKKKKKRGVLGSEVEEP